MAPSTWLEQQRRVAHNDLSGVMFDPRLREVIESRTLSLGNDEVRLLRHLLQPDAKHLLSLLDELHLIEPLGDPDPDEYTADLLRAWLDPLPSVLPRTPVFEVTFNLDGAPGLAHGWGWLATRYSREYDLLCELGTFDPGRFGPYVPVGLIAHNDPVRSAALVIASLPQAGSAILL